jgi:hypothetical protein
LEAQFIERKCTSIEWKGELNTENCTFNYYRFTNKYVVSVLCVLIRTDKYGGMFDNSYFDNSKSEKTDYVGPLLEGLVFEKNFCDRSTESRIFPIESINISPNLTQPNLT